MWLRLRTALFAAVAGLAQTSLQLPALADGHSYPLRHAGRHTAYPHSATRHAVHPLAQPLPPPPPLKFGWVLMPGNAYAPIAPQDYALPASEYYSRLWEPYPFCCPDPYFAPAIFP